MTTRRSAATFALCGAFSLASTSAAQQPPFAGGLQSERTTPPLVMQGKLKADGARTGMLEWARQANRVVRERIPLPVFATVSAPGGVRILFFDANAKAMPIDSGGVVGLRSRFRYVFALENLGPRPDVRFFGSMEVVNGPWLPPSATALDHPVAVAVSDADVLALASGAMITKIIVLENPATAAPVTGSPKEPLVYDVSDAQTAIVEAKLRGRVFMIIRLGDRHLLPHELVGLAADQSLFLPSAAGLAAMKDGSKLSLSHFQPVAGGSEVGGQAEILQASYTPENAGLPKGYSRPPCGPNCGGSHGYCPHCGPTWPKFAPIPGGTAARPAFMPFFDRYDDEWVCDGADHSAKTALDAYGRLINLDAGDTVGLYKDHDGRRRIAESNLACVYSPRFVEIRAVQNVEAYERWLNDQRLGQSDYLLGLKGVKHSDVGERAQAVEGLQTRLRASGLIGLAWSGVFSEVRILEGLEQAVGHHVDKNFEFSLWLKNHEQLFVRRNLEFARTLTRAENPVIVSSTLAHGQVLASELPAEIRKVDVKPGRPARLILEKTVNQPTAKPGDAVTFVLRYTNVGDEPMTSVAVVDSLPARLEYVLGSAKSSADAVFTAEENDVGSVTLRWEIKGTLNAKGGGLLEFQARLR